MWLEEWLRHQRRDEYWKHASVCEDFAAIRCPVLAVSGWADGYSNAVFRLLASLDFPRRGLIGPWSHKYPHLGQPGPAIGFLQELVQWWDHWLKGVDNDAMAGPMLRVWMQESMPPSTAYAERPGRWVGEERWPSPTIEASRHPLARHRIAPVGEEVEGESVTIESPLSVGQFAGKWCSYNAPPDLPYDQREEDGGSLVFDGDVLPERTEILGSPVVDLSFAASAPVAMVAVRLSDVAPDGAATRVTYGLSNLTHQASHESPHPLVPGRTYRARVALNGVAHAFPPGHKLRLSLSTSYWPLAWPPPEPVRLTVFPGESALELPVRRSAEGTDEPAITFGEPEGAPPLATTQLRPGEQRWEVNRDLVTYRSALEVVKDLGTVRFDDIALDVTRRADERYSWVGNTFDSVRGEVAWVMGFARDGWSVRTETRTVLSCTPTEFRLHGQLDAYEGEERVAARSWSTTVPRDHL
jgi:uncharacterized protein